MRLSDIPKIASEHEKTLLTIKNSLQEGMDASTVYEYVDRIRNTYTQQLDFVEKSIEKYNSFMSRMTCNTISLSIMRQNQRLKPNENESSTILSEEMEKAAEMIPGLFLEINETLSFLRAHCLLLKNIINSIDLLLITK